MTRIFLSHSSQDNPRAFALSQWLRENGWQDVFLDRIPRQGIAAGEDWKAKIHESMDASAAGIFLISEGWLASEWCRTEMTLAYNLNKLIFGVVVDDLPRDQIPELLKSNWQVVDLHGGRDHDTHIARYEDGTTSNTTLSYSGLANLKEGLHRARIAPEHFSWPPEDEPYRAPWRGLSPMEPQDAGIFFGRDAQTARALDTIRKLREGTPPRLLAIVGASGAGKSSFLRAGLIPRLRRDDRNYLTLPLIRPEGGALDAFAQSLTEAAAQKCPRALGDIRSWVHAAANGAPEDLTTFLTELAAAHRLPAFDDQPPPTPTILLPIDQGEELFQSTGRAQGGPFLSLLARLLQRDSPKFLALITIRSDSYEPLQNAPELSGLDHSALSLSAIAKGEYGRIIIGPVEKLQAGGRKLEFDPAITDTLLAEFDKGLGPDALPLLAFTLDRLYRDYHSAGKITLADYETMGGIAGSIDAAVVNAMRWAMQHRNIAADELTQQTLLRRTMIPWFAGIDPETGIARRNVSRYNQLPAETQPLVDALVEQRLLTKDGDTIEPGHEAMLRKWRALDGWLTADRELLITLEALRSAALVWQTKERHKNYLDHKAGRLEDAEKLVKRPDLWQQLEVEDRDYLVDCRAAVKRGMLFRRIVAGAFAVVVGLGVVATGYLATIAKLAEDEARAQTITAQRERQRAETFATEAATQADLAEVRAEAAERAEDEALRQSAQAAQSRVDALVLLAEARARTDPVAALKLVIVAWPTEEGQPFPSSVSTLRALEIAFQRTRQHTILAGDQSGVTALTFSPGGPLLASGGLSGTIRIWDVGKMTQVGDAIDAHPRAEVKSIAFSPDGLIFVSTDSDAALAIWHTNREPSNGSYHQLAGIATSAVFSADGKRLAVGYETGEIEIFLTDKWDSLGIFPLDQQPGVTDHEELIFENDAIFGLAFLPDSYDIIGSDQSGNLAILHSLTGYLDRTILSHSNLGNQDLNQSILAARAFRSGSHTFVEVGMSDGSLRAWRLGEDGPYGTGKFGPETWRLAGFGAGGRAAAAGPDGELWLYHRSVSSTLDNKIGRAHV